MPAYRPPLISANEITPKNIYLSRRGFLGTAALVGVLAAVVLLVIRDPATGARGFRKPTRASRPDATDGPDATDRQGGTNVTTAADRTLPTEPPTDTGAQFVQDEAHGLFRTIRTHRKVLLRLGSGAGLIGALRAGRQVILPLWAVSVGLDDSTAALVIASGWLIWMLVAGFIIFLIFSLASFYVGTINDALKGL